jgi:hypothetical protein
LYSNPIFTPNASPSPPHAAWLQKPLNDDPVTCEEELVGARAARSAPPLLPPPLLLLLLLLQLLLRTTLLSP